MVPGQAEDVDGLAEGEPSRATLQIKYTSQVAVKRFVEPT
jgi:hypothetical protein